MSTSTMAPSGNVLVDALSPQVSALVKARSSRVALCAGDTLSEVYQPIPHVYFPLDGFIIKNAEMAGHPLLNVALIGFEGMLGASLVLGVRQAPWQSTVHGTGIALRMPSARWQQLLREQPEIFAVACRYLYVRMMQNNRMSACNRFHPVKSRLARLLLMAQDRTTPEFVQLTQKHLAGMLGVLRSAVSIAAAELQESKCIQYTRGSITIQDRLQLQANACPCYAADIRDHNRQFPPPS